MQFGDLFDLHYGMVTEGQPFDIKDIIKSKRKHFLIEIPNPKEPLSALLLSHLLCEIKQEYQYSRRTILYLLYPEKLSDYLEDCDFNDLSSYATLRIFSNGFYFPHPKWDWSMLLLPGYRPNECETSKESKGVLDEAMREEEKELKDQTSFKSLFSNETLQAVKVIAKELELPISQGLFQNHGKQIIHWFSLPPKLQDKLNYEPYQKRYKPEDMLNLKKRIGKFRYDPTQHDPVAIQMIQDLKPKGNDYGDHS